MLSPTLLEALRDYWRSLKRKPTDMVYFRAGHRHTSNRVPITPRAVWYCVPTCCPAGGPAATGFIPTRCATVSLRTCWKTERTCAPFNYSWDITISKETTIYLHLSRRHLHATASPLDVSRQVER